MTNRTFTALVRTEQHVEEIEVVADLDTVEQAVLAEFQHRPDVVILDIVEADREEAR
ncbi:hypothetical protein [Agromyces sp. NPDC058064]|uniref:hypothetical protein n=1 Tax=Agromyces sp. NPDC058064 TaxID=3346322 RepID=UPI0036DEBBEE